MEIDFSPQSSKAQILEKLLQEDLTPIQISNKMDIGASTIRDHLRLLQEKEYVEPYFERASRGRPKKKYTITRKGRSVFPRKHGTTLSYLIRRTKKEFGEETLLDLMRGVADEMTDVEDGLLEKDRETRVQKLVKFFENLDLYPSLERKNGAYIIEYGNCGVLGVMKEVHEYLCYTHRGVIANYLPETRVEQVESYARGDDNCAHRIVPNGRENSEQ